MTRKPEELNIIVIDPSLRSSGVLTCKQGNINTFAIQRKDERLQVLGYFTKYFVKLVKETSWDLCVIENYSFGSQSSSVSVQSEIGGIIRGCFAAVNVPIIEIAPASWKAITGFGKLKLKKNSVAEKREYINKCIELFGIECDTTDEVDAFLMFKTIQMISRGQFKKGTGSNIRYELERLKIIL